MLQLLPAIVSLGLHGILILLLIVGLPGDERKLDIKPVPKVIQAKLMFEAKPVPAAKPAPKPVAKPAPKPKPEPKPAPKPAPKPKPEPKPKPKPAPKQPSDADLKKKKAAEDAAKKAAEEARRREEQARLQREQEAEMAAAMAAEEDARAAEQVSSYEALIGALVENSWTRPPTARNGMVAIVAIETVPTGEIVNQYIVKGSGDDAFDLSVLRAVTRLGRIEELGTLARQEPTIYERNFRRFQFKFNPQDLRR